MEIFYSIISTPGKFLYQDGTQHSCFTPSLILVFTTEKPAYIANGKFWSIALVQDSDGIVYRISPLYKNGDFQTKFNKRNIVYYTEGGVVLPNNLIKLLLNNRDILVRNETLELTAHNSPSIMFMAVHSHRLSVSSTKLQKTKKPFYT